MFTTYYEWDFVKQLKPVGYVHDCQLEKMLVCIALVRKKGRQKNKSCSYLVVNRESKRDE